jgi:hypothetical protein
MLECCKEARALPPPHHPATVNRYINPASDLNCSSGNGLQLDWVRAQDAEALPLSAAQLGIWFAQQINPSASDYNIGEYIEIEGSIDPILFERALRQVVLETEALRVQITEQAGEPRQVVGFPPAWSMTVIDVSAETDARAAAETWMRGDLARPIEPTRGPLFGFALFKVSPELFFWYARYHHIIMDAFGWWRVAWRGSTPSSASIEACMMGRLALSLFCSKTTAPMLQANNSRKTGNTGATIWFTGPSPLVSERARRSNPTVFSGILPICRFRV